MLHRGHLTKRRAVSEDNSSRCDEAGFWFRRTVLFETSEHLTAARWEQLSNRIRTYQQVQAIVAHVSSHGRAAQRALLMSRCWPSLMLPLT